MWCDQAKWVRTQKILILRYSQTNQSINLHMTGCQHLLFCKGSIFFAAKSHSRGARMSQDLCCLGLKTGLENIIYYNIYNIIYYNIFDIY